MLPPPRTWAGIRNKSRSARWLEGSLHRLELLLVQMSQYSMLPWTVFVTIWKNHFDCGWKLRINPFHRVMQGVLSLNLPCHATSEMWIDGLAQVVSGRPGCIVSSVRSKKDRPKTTSTCLVGTDSCRHASSETGLPCSRSYANRTCTSKACRACCICSDGVVRTNKFN